MPPCTSAGSGSDTAPVLAQALIRNRTHTDTQRGINPFVFLLNTVFIKYYGILDLMRFTHGYGIADDL